MLFDKLIQIYLWLGAVASVVMMVVIPTLMSIGVLHD